MGSKSIANRRTRPPAAAWLPVCVGAGALLLTATLALAQDGAGRPTPVTADEPGFLESIGQWLDRQAAKIGSGFKDAGAQVENFGREAGAAVRIPAARVISGHERCKIAPNGAPDCVAAAHIMCKAKGFESGKSVDMTTAEICKPEVYASGRNSGPGCHTETFVSRVICQ
jgi:hypothetical protein